MPSTPIGDLIVVPRRTVLVGRAIPTPNVVGLGREIVDRSWVAYLMVTGDPRAVVDELRGEFSKAGFDFLPTRVRGGAEMGLTPAFCDRKALTYVCGAFAVPFDPADRRRVAVELYRRPKAGPRPPESVLRVQLVDVDLPVVPGPPPRARERSGRDPLGPEPPHLPSRWDPLPGHGEHFGIGYPRITSLKVEEGSRLLAPTVRRLDCDTVGFEALLAVDGDSDQVLARYRRQAGKIVGTEWRYEPARRQLEDGSVLVSTNVSDMAGPHYDFDMVVPRSGPAILRVGACYRTQD